MGHHAQAFGRGGTTLVLIGDPKQAIYAFRGADVHAYLAGPTPRSSREWTLDVNWRSDEGLLDAYDALFAGAQLGDAGITYRNIRAAPANRTPGWSARPDDAPLRVRILHAGDGLVPPTKTGAAAGRRRPRAAHRPRPGGRRRRLLSRGAEIVARRRDGAEIGRTPLHPGHIAVLVRVNAMRRSCATPCRRPASRL